MEGTLAWSTRSDPALVNRQVAGMALDPGGNVYQLELYGDLKLSRYSGSSGARRWTVSVGDGHAGASHVALGPDANPIVVTHDSSEQLVFRKYSGSTGAVIWQTTVSDAGFYRRIVDAMTDSSGNFYCTGWRSDTSYQNGYDILTMMVTATGVVKWVRLVPRLDSGRELGSSIIAGPNGTVFVGGIRDVQAGAGDEEAAFVGRYYASSGKVIFEQTQPRAAPGSAIATTVALAADGTVRYIYEHFDGSKYLGGLNASGVQQWEIPVNQYPESYSLDASLVPLTVAADGTMIVPTTAIDAMGGDQWAIWAFQ
jgi:hypothetical protein